MRFSQIILLCLLATALYFVSQSIGSSTSPPITPHGRRPMSALRASSSIKQDAHHKFKVDAGMKRSTYQASSPAKEYASSHNDAELVYHTDYHGVTTHPTPTPKHPKP